MPGRFSLTVVVGVAAIAWALALVAHGTPVDRSFFTPATTVVSALVVLGLVFDRWAWAWRGIRSIWHRPDLRGTWKGELRSNFPGAAASIEAYISIHETYSSLTVALFTGESGSKTSVATIETDKDETDTITGIYRSEPHLSRREQNPMHDGAFLLRVEGQDLTGKYWTDRGTQGEASFRRVSEKKSMSFSDARTLGTAGVPSAKEIGPGQAAEPTAPSLPPAGPPKE